MTKILLIATAHARLGSTGEPTGLWFEELTTPYYAFIDAGAAVDIATLPGGKVPIDPRSLTDKPPSVERFQADAEAMRKIERAKRLATLNIADYDAVFLPGGHGTMFDLPESLVLAAALSDAWAQGKVVSAVCHGPAGLLHVKDAQGRPLLAGRIVSAFTNSEETAVGLTRSVPFLLETAIRDLGARYESGPDFQPFARRDGKLVTGQNPASSAQVAALVLEAIKG
jgi:putative intracellular protease/amidase